MAKLNKCPNTNSKEFKQLESQVGNDLAWATWMYYQGDYPDMKTTSQLRKELQLPSQINESNKPAVLRRIRLYNSNNNTAHSVKLTPIGESQRLRTIIFPNYLPVNVERQRQRDYTRKGKIVKFIDAFNETYKEGDFYMGDEALRAQEEGEYVGAINEKIANKLKSLFPEVNVSFTKLEEDRGQAKGLSVMIDSIEQNEDTLPHEYAHLYINWFRDNSIVKEAIDKYGSEEALVQAIGEEVVLREGEAYDWWTKFTKWIQNLFNTLSNKSKEELKDILTDAFLQRIDLDTGAQLAYNKIKERANDTTFYQKVSDTEIASEGSKKKLTNVQEALKKTIINVGRRREILEQQRKTKLVKQQEELLEKLNIKYEKAEYLDGITTWVEFAHKQFEKLQEDIGVVRNRAETLRNLKAFLDSNDSIVEAISPRLNKNEFPEDLKGSVDKLETEVAKLGRTIQNLKREYLKYAIENTAIMTDVFEWNKSKDQVLNLLSKPVRDISYTQTNWTSIFEAHDDALKVIAKAVSNQKEIARQKTIDEMIELTKAQKELEAKGIKNTDWMFSEYAGKKTGYLETERDWDYYTNKRIEFYKKINKKYGVESKDDLSGDKLKAYKKAEFEFYAEHKLSDKESRALIQEMQQSLSKEDFELWYNMNVVENPAAKYPYVIPRKKSERFEAIKKDPNKLKFYNLIVSKKIRYEQRFPEKFKNARLAPQIRKDTIERLKSKDVKSTVEELREHYKVMEDEDQRGSDFGILDESGNVVQFIPIYYMNRIKDPRNLSTDITSTMTSFINMANDREHMLEIIDNLELARDVIKERGVLKLSALGNPMEQILKYAGKSEKQLIKNKENAGNIVKRLDEFFTMSIYGQYEKQGKTVAGVDTQKVIDSFTGLTAMVQLGMNTYAAIANVNVGNAMLAVEGLAKEYFDVKSLAWADKEYTKELPNTMKNVGQRLTDSKLDLWLIKHNTLEEYDEKIRNLDNNRKTLFSRMFRRSAMFFQSKAGEHWIHSKGSMALAYQFRFNPDEKRFQTKKQFYQPLEVLRGELRAELETLTPSEYKNLSRKIKDKYKPKIDKLKGELDSKWKGLTNYWDAHEVVDNKLVLKKEFETDSKTKDHLLFTNTQHSINRALHGNYGKYGAAVQKTALGRMAMLFHKWIKPYWDRRYQTLHHDVLRESDVEGYWNTVGRFMVQLYKDWRQAQFSLAKRWDTLTDIEKANFKRAMSEVTILVSMSLLATAMMSLKGDDDDSWALNMAAYQANRMFAEIGVMTPGPTMISEFVKIVRNPLAGVGYADNLIGYMQFWNWFDKIERGKYEDMYKIQRTAIKTVPLVSQIYDLGYPEEKLVFYNTFK